MAGSTAQAQHRVEPGRRLGLFEFAFLHYALMLFARALDPILIIASTRRKLLNHFVEAAAALRYG
jgi:hypothetical protein